MLERPACWRCGREVSEEALTYEARLVPRPAGRGGPVLLYRCPCGVESVVEKNAARERLLVPPPAAAVKSPTVRGVVEAEARRWMAEHGAEREAFHAREAAAEPSRRRIGAQDEDPPRPPPPESPPPADDREKEAPEAGRPPPPREIAGVITAYETLGLPLTATAAEVRARYRELAKRAHPDRVADLDDEIRRAAERRFREIRDAYERITGGDGD